MYLFDIDGTLLLSGGAGSRVINRVFERRFEVEGAMDSVSPGGKTDDMIFQECAIAKLGRELSRSEVDSMQEAYLSELPEELASSPGFRLMPFARECLDFLVIRSPQMGIATGNVESAAKSKLARAGLSHYFCFGGYGSDSAQRSELVSAAVQRGSAIHGAPIAVEKFVVVGDTLRDIEAARACGVRVLAVAAGSCTIDELRAAKPDALFETLEELPAWHLAEF
ncbi:MAG: HAD hydrolase-like protein [Kofleriaceae bacterium]|nr:HAD hydrolase-like protein [Kofleriaceae bacterium]